MTRGNARELALHLIYGRAFTGEEPEQVISTRLEKEYYAQLGQENDVYSERPSRAQLRYIDTVVTGVANREEELDAQIRKYSIGWGYQPDFQAGALYSASGDLRDSVRRRRTGRCRCFRGGSNRQEV